MEVKNGTLAAIKTGAFVSAVTLARCRGCPRGMCPLDVISWGVPNFGLGKTCCCEFENGPIQIPIFEEKVTYYIPIRLILGQILTKITCFLFVCFVCLFVLFVFVLFCFLNEILQNF